MAGVLDTIKSSLGFGPAAPANPQEKVNVAANALGGLSGSAASKLRGRNNQIDAELNRQLGMVPPQKGQD